MFVGVLKLSLLARGSRSLKEKRHVLKKIKDRVKNRFNVSIAEVDPGQSWDRFYLGISVTGEDSRLLNSIIDKVRMEIEGLYIAEILDSKFEVISYE